MNHQNRKQICSQSRVSEEVCGFTLIEMSIVIVIIGLIVAGVVIGKDLLQSSRVMTLTSDPEKFKSAALTFKQKYNYYPGDFPGATTLWGTTASPACNSTGATAVSSTTSTTTCNGNGNGVIGQRGASIAETEQREGFLFWQHLANAGLIEGPYSGFPTSTTNTQAISAGVNAPAARYRKRTGITNPGFSIEYSTSVLTVMDSTANWPVAGRYGHVLSWSNPATGTAGNQLLTPAEAFSVDSKIDDSLPYSGKVFSFGSNAQATTYGVNACVASNAYAFTVTTARCGQYRRLFFEE